MQYFVESFNSMKNRFYCRKSDILSKENKTVPIRFNADNHGIKKYLKELFLQAALEITFPEKKTRSLTT